MSGFYDNGEYTSESVTQGHPDKACDAMDPGGVTRVFSVMNLTGEGTLDPNRAEGIALKVLQNIGYGQDGQIGLAPTDFGSFRPSVNLCLGAQSPDIAQGVNPGGAGDQGMMFGYACDEVMSDPVNGWRDIFMPASHYYACRLSDALTAFGKTAMGRELIRPDGKTQVTVSYEGGRIVAVSEVVISVQTAPRVEVWDAREAVLRYAREHTGLWNWLVPQRELFNPTGAFTIGGPLGDAGLTGRKIIVDTYGGHGPHGGGAFSGKDPTKVDRSGAYAARFIAKHIVAAGIASRCCVQLAYAIGMAEPRSLAIDTYGTLGEAYSYEQLLTAVRELFPIAPSEIRDELQLWSPIYGQTAAGGHFGRPYDPDTGAFSWERVDQNLCEQLRRSCSTQSAPRGAGWGCSS